MARFPPGKGGGEGVAYGRKGKGILIHSLTDAAGMPLAMCTTPDNGDERAQVIPLLDNLHVRTGRRAARASGSRSLRPIKGMMLKTFVIDSANAVSDLRSRNGCGRPESRQGDRLKRVSRAFKPSGHSRGTIASTAGWSAAGSASPHVSMLSLPLP